MGHFEPTPESAPWQTALLVEGSLFCSYTMWYRLEDRLPFSLQRCSLWMNPSRHKRAFDGCSRKMQLRSDSVDCEPAAAFCIGVVLQAAVNHYRAMPQPGVMDRMKTAYKSSPGLSRKIGRRGSGGRSSRSGDCGHALLVGTAGGCFRRMAASSSSLFA